MKLIGMDEREIGPARAGSLNRLAQRMKKQKGESSARPMQAGWRRDWVGISGGGRVLKIGPSF